MLHKSTVITVFKYLEVSIKQFIFILAGFVLLVDCGGLKSSGAKTSADKAITALKTATKNLEDKSVIIDTDPIQTDVGETDIEAVESAVAALQKAIAKKGVSEKTKAFANQAIEAANQAIEGANGTIKIVSEAFLKYHLSSHMEGFINRIADLEAQTEKVRIARSEYIEDIVRETRDSINGLRGHVTKVRHFIKNNVSEEEKALRDVKRAHWAVERANQSITKAEQAIKDALPLT